MSTLTAVVVLGTVLHVAVLGFMVWFRVRRTEPDHESKRFTPCAVCGEPSAGLEYDGLDPDEQLNPETGRAWSYDMAHYRPLCADHWPAQGPTVRKHPSGPERMIAAPQRP